MENFIEYVNVCKKLNSHFLIVDTSTKDGTIQLNLFVGHLAHTSHLMVEFTRISDGMRKTINNFNILHNKTDLTIIETELRKSLELIESTKPFMDIDNWDDAHKKKYSKFGRITNEIYNEIDKHLIIDETSLAKTETKTNNSHPFLSSDVYKVFNYFDEYYLNVNQTKYTYIFNHITEQKIDQELTESEYFNWLLSNGKVNKARKQINAQSSREYEKLQNLYNDYLKSSEK
jgi:hypothetical protein